MPERPEGEREDERFPGWYIAALDRERLDRAYREFDDEIVPAPVHREEGKGT